jgi:hypothetical protein
MSLHKDITMVTDTKTTKSTRFFNQNENKGRPNSWNKKNKIKNMINANNNPRRFYCKEETKQGYDLKM